MDNGNEYRPLQLSVVDQSPVREGGTGGDALRETIDLAIATESMGYKRYWVAEHHNLSNFAGTCRNPDDRSDLVCVTVTHRLSLTR